MNNVKGKKVFVGLSGGVDSSVTAALLKKAGADVYGVFIKGWYPPGMSCTWSEDRRDAMRVAAHLGIPFHTLDASIEYKKYVIDYLLHEYGEGRTPNPDIMCNREVKFGVFYEFAKKHGADYVATGHYAQHVDERLLRGVDREKDQSYFLWAIAPEALAMTLFPLGAYTKEQVRELARGFELPTAAKRDSQGICFLGQVSMDEFLRAEFEVVNGEARDAAGLVVGTHDGSLLYTVGERIALHDAPPGPWYVQSKDIRANTIVVSKEQAQPESKKEIVLQSINLFAEPSTDIEAQYRYHGPRITGTYSKSVFTPTCGLTETLAQGQSLVMYKGEQVLGGGIIG
jgi:tRNA-specific 2-thiouridylase